MVRIGAHRSTAGPRHTFIYPTPDNGEVLEAVYISFFGGQFGTDFQVKAHIYSKTVRYKQYIKGQFTYDGVAQEHILNAGNLQPNWFLEDANGTSIYGNRNCNIAGLSTYEPPDGHGKPYLFIGSDTPSDNLECESGTEVKIDLTFKGEIVDVGHPFVVYASRIWHVQGSCKKL